MNIPNQTICYFFTKKNIQNYERFDCRMSNKSRTSRFLGTNLCIFWILLIASEFSRRKTRRTSVHIHMTRGSLDLYSGSLVSFARNFPSNLRLSEPQGHHLFLLMSNCSEILTVTHPFWVHISIIYINQWWPELVTARLAEAAAAAQSTSLQIEWWAQIEWWVKNVKLSCHCSPT